MGGVEHEQPAQNDQADDFETVQEKVKVNKKQKF